MMTRLIILLALLWSGESWAQTWYYPGGKADTAFGDDTTTSSWQPQNFNYGGSALTLPAGNVTRLAAFVDSNGSAGMTLKLGLYDSGGNLVVQGSVGLPTSSTKAWNIADVTDTPISAGTYYVLGSGSTNQLRYGFDLTGSGKAATGTFAASMAASLSLSDEAGQDYGTGAEVQEGGGGPTCNGGLLMRGVGGC